MPTSQATTPPKQQKIGWGTQIQKVWIRGSEPLPPLPGKMPVLRIQNYARQATRQDSTNRLLSSVSFATANSKP
jgi:hypothetical protein